MPQVKFDTDRVADSTDNNEYAEGYRDETLVDLDLTDVDIPIADDIPDGVDETREGDRPIYDEEGYENKPGI